MDDILKRLQSLQPCKWAIHEKHLCRELNMSAKEGLGVRKQLGQLLSALKNGGWGQKRNYTWTETGLPMMDLGETSIPNTLGIHYIFHGEKEMFPTDSLSQSSGIPYNPRYFTIGGFKDDSDIKGNDCTIKSQCNIMRMVTGHAGTGNCADKESRQRREANWLPWYQKDNSNGKKVEFEKIDLNLIAKQFPDVWNVKIKDEESTIERRVLAEIGNDIRAILQSCNQIPRRTRAGGQVVPTIELSTKKRQQPHDEMINPTRKKRCVTVSPKTATLPTSDLPPPVELSYQQPDPELPTSLTLGILRDAIKSDLAELAAIEYAVHLLFTKKLSINVAAESFQCAGIPAPHTISLEELHKVKPALRTSALRNVTTARQTLLDRFPVGLFRPKDSDMLHTWMSDGKRYTGGERLPAMNYERHPKSNNMWLTDKAAHYIRHIMYCFKVAPSRFPSMMNCFAVLLLGRPLTLLEFSSTSTLRSRFVRLYEIDSFRCNVKFEKFITKPDEYGFHRVWYMVTDDSKHHDQSRHATLISVHREDGEDQSDNNGSPKPSIRLVTASVAGSKDSDGNASLNFSAVTECFSGSVCSHIGGGVTDNAADALLETQKTFGLFMEALEHHPHPDAADMRFFYGVKRRPTMNGDMFHIDNLMCAHASNHAFGETVRGEHSQVHHRQLLQSLHDIHKNNRVVSQRAMGTVLEGRRTPFESKRLVNGSRDGL
jgi:hypothetical protein